MCRLHVFPNYLSPYKGIDYFSYMFEQYDAVSIYI